MLIYNKIIKKIKSFRSKSVNMERLITEEYLSTISLYECKIILLVLMQKGMKVGLENGEENQEFILSFRKNRNIFKDSTLYYKAITNLTIKEFITKVDGKQSTYYVNPKIISNMTYQQEVDAGLKKEFISK